VQSLQREGFTSTQIFNALSQADIKKEIRPSPEEAYPEEQQTYPEYPQQMPREQMPQQAPMPMPSQAPERGASREQIEEVAEAIIDEKWEELMKGVNKIIAWKDTAEERLIKIEESMEDLKKRFSELHTGVLGRIAEYDKGIRDVGTDIKAMQEVFKKTLPKFTENIAALERLSKKKKSKQRKQ
jgi:hypothetical protein